MKQRQVEADKELDKYFIPNTAGISLVEFFWGFGLPLVMESVFIQVLLHTLGASGLVIGSIPSILFFGLAVTGIFSSYFASFKNDRRRLLIITHLIPSVIMFFYSFILLITGFGTGSVPIFLAFYTLLCTAVGLILPVWQDYTVAIFSRAKVLKALSMMRFLQTLGKLIGTFLLAMVLKRMEVTSLSTALVFAACALLFGGASFFFLLTREPGTREAGSIKSLETVSGAGFFKYLKETLQDILTNRNFLYYMGSELEFFAVISALSFYAAYGLDFAGFSPALAAGGLVAVNIAGQLTANFILGIKKGPGLRRSAWISKGVSLTGILILILWHGIPSVMIAGFLLGYSRAIRAMIFSPAVKQLAGHKDATGFFALAPLITLPAAGLIPLIAGVILDASSGFGILSYRLLFGFFGLFIIISFFMLKKTELE
ncbi:MAG: hypothetical protein JEY99_05155 [Spirochaetales bacterium]|nr:hypothetical protein [Spirochaetales bacterium]